MKPRLIFPANSPDFETITLENFETFSLGRSESNELKILDVDVSRRHCLIEAAVNGNFQLRDLQSRNGTYVNESRVTETTALKHGDYIRIGKTRLLFLSGDETVAMPLTQNFQFDEGWLVTNSEIVFEVGQQELARMPSDLGALAKFGQALNEIENAADLQHRFLEIIFEIIPAMRGAILLYEGETEDPASVVVAAAGLSSDEERTTGQMTISRTVCRRVLGEQTALVSNDVSHQDFKKAESLIATHVSSLLCVPFRVGAASGASASGLIYLDSSDPETDFTENHLRQAIAVSFLVSAALERQHSLENLKQENARLQTALDIETNLVGISDEINKVLQMIGKVSPADSNVLITGESGTGKELAAQSIHRNSRRGDKPFVAINCAALNENLLESELFGHEKGAFTGAFAQKKGKLETADGGTVFLDEIAELAPRLQAKLLRVIQEREFERVGGTRPIKTNVRLIAATNRNLAEEVKKGEFREDLYFRLNVVRLLMPALRSRKADIPLLAQHFIRKHSERCNRRVVGLSRAALAVLMKCDWVGNVRQLENTIESAIVLGATDMILPEDLPEEILAEGMSCDGAADAEEQSYQHQLLLAKRRIVKTAIESADGNLSEAARRLGIHPNNLHRLLNNLGIKEEGKKS